MLLSDRAKIFAPFSALKGLSEALTAKEKIHVPKVLLTESASEELDQKLHLIKLGDNVTIIYYHLDEHNKGEYLQVSGKISKIDYNRRMLIIVDTKICMNNIREIKFNT